MAAEFPPDNEDVLESMTAAGSALPDGLSREVDSPPAERAARPISVGIVAIAEGGLVLAAMVLAWLGLRNPAHTLFGFWSAERWVPTLAWGVAGVLPMVAMLFVLDRAPGPFFRRMRRETSQLVVSLFEKLTLWEMAIIALLAGICEEILFRWSMQDGLAYLLGGPAGWWISLLAVSLIFGLAHYVNFTYFALTAIIGLWLGWLMVVSKTWFAPAIAHALYDFVALWYLTRVRRAADDDRPPT